MINFPDIVDNTNFKYLKIDNKVIVSIVFEEYPEYTSFLGVMEAIPKDINYDLSVYIKKLDTAKVLKELTYKISSSNAEIKSINKNQVDIDLISNAKDEAISLRKEIQLHNQEIYGVTIIVTFVGNDYDRLYQVVKEFQSKLYSKSYITSVTNFRHLDSYILSLPLNRSNNKLIELNERTFTTDSLSLNFPFYTKNTFDINGVIFGNTLSENKICNIDIFDEKYINSNMCILGSSGSGKSYYTKLMIIRHYVKNKCQYIFDLQGEYIKLVKFLKGNVINFNDEDETFFNIFEVFDYEIIYNNWFEMKISKITHFITNLIGDFDNKEYNVISEAVKKAYNAFGINEDKSSVIKKSTDIDINLNNEIIFSNMFPNITDMTSYIKSKKLVKKINDNIIKKYKFLTKCSNINLSSNLTVFNTSNLKGNDFNTIVNYFLQEILESILIKKDKTVIYIDEIWKYIYGKANEELSKTIFEMYKTIRKYNASIIGITQDVNDFFKTENGNVGKGILNNCGFKLFFRIEYSDKKILENINIIEKSDLEKIYRLDKGMYLIFFNNNKVTLKVKSSRYEEEIMEGRYENIISSK